MKGISLPDRVDLTMEETKIAEFDNLFMDAQAPLEELRDAHSSLYRSMITF